MYPTICRKDGRPGYRRQQRVARVNSELEIGETVTRVQFVGRRHDAAVGLPWTSLSLRGGRHQRGEQAARDLECDEDEERFDERVRKLVKHKPVEKPE